MTWTWACANEIGSGHVKRQQRCQDAYFCFSNGNIFIAAVADGAGSAAHGGHGAWLCCRELKKQAGKYVAKNNRLPTKYIFATWLSQIIDHTTVISASLDKTPRDFASTLIFLASNGKETFVAQIGDSCAVFKEQDTDIWICPVWPTKGQYASTTCFVTDRVVQLYFAEHKNNISRVALFSDGLEKLILDQRNRIASPGFLDPITNPLSNNLEGLNRKLSEEVKFFLGSERVLERTDDDKTIILAQRKVGEVLCR